MKTSRYPSTDSRGSPVEQSPARPTRRRFGASVAALAAGVLLAGGSAPSWAEDVVRVGVIGEFSGVFSIYGQQSRRAIELFQKEHGDKVGNTRVEVLYRDTTGLNPEVSRRAAQELVTREHVQFLAGFGLTPNALAVAPVATQTKTPMVVMNAAATVFVPTRSPYIVRFSLSQQQVAEPLAQWAAKQGIKSVYIIVPDYAPGIDVEKYFSGAFTAAGGKVVGSVKTPLGGVEYAPYLQRAAAAEPDAIFFMSPSGDQGLQFLKAFRARGMDKDIKLLSTGELTDEIVLDSLGDDAIGLITSMHYSAAHDSDENRKYVAAWKAAYGETERPNWYATGAWDGMAAIYHTIEKLGGKIEGDKAVAELKGYKAQSSRGPISIDEGRDIVQNMYIRRVEKVDGRLANIEFETIPNVGTRQE